MNIEINKELGTHVCFQCKSALEDADFTHCGICLNADEPGMCFDYVCPQCKFNGRWTIALIQAEPSIASALDKLKDVVQDQLPPPARRRRHASYKRWDRNSGRFFRDF